MNRSKKKVFEPENNNYIQDLDDESFSVKEPNDFYDDKKDFVTLDAWKKCREIKLFFYKRIIPFLPKDEKYNLDIQIRKAAINITANISEGYGRFYYLEGIQYYRISRASLYELKDHLIRCCDLGFINDELNKEGEKMIESAKRTLNGFINFTKTKLN